MIPNGGDLSGFFRSLFPQGIPVSLDIRELLPRAQRVLHGGRRRRYPKAKRGRRR